MSDKIAIDVALLPPKRVMDEAIKINKQFESRFTLNKTDYLPHITLCQVILKREDLAKAEVKLQKIAPNFKPLKLKAFVVNKPSAMFEVIRTKELDNLHKRVMTEFEGLVTYDAQEKNFYDDHIREKSLDYVRNFVSYAYDNYYPHITLGPERVDTELDLEFICDRLTICHLGNYNTCRKILFEASLKKR